MATALTLHQLGVPCIVFESVPELQPLGVGINLLPHAVRVLDALGLSPALNELAIQTAELCYYNKFGQLIWAEPRGRAAAPPVMPTPNIRFIADGCNCCSMKPC